MGGAVRRGALIVLEGVDRSGKTTQSTALLEFLRSSGREVSFLRYPDRSTATGKVIDEYLSTASSLNDHAIHLLFAANRWESKAVIESKLWKGETLVVDRYSFSGVAYSSAKGLDLDWCKSCETGLPAPDVVIQLEIDPAEAAKRGDFGKERYEKVAFQQAVANIFKRFQCLPYWKTVDATAPADIVTQQVQKLALEAIDKAADDGSDFQFLW